MNERQELEIVIARQAAQAACRGVLAILYHLRSQIPGGQETGPLVDAIRDLHRHLST